MSPRGPALLSLLPVQLVCAALLLGCPPAPEPVCVGERGDEVPAALVRVDGQLRAVGFDRAAAAGSTSTLASDDVSVEVDVDADGRFDTTVDAGGETATFLDHTWRVRHTSALECVVGRPLEGGTLSNDVAVTRCGAKSVALIPASADGTLEIVPLDGAQKARALFPVDSDGRGANPWHVSAHDDRAAVTLFGQHTVAWVDACDGQVLSVASPATATGEPALVDVAPPASLAQPLDADGDGDDETTVGTMRLRHPEGVAIVGDRVFVGFTNLLQAGTPAQYGPGVVAAFDVVSDELRPAGFAVLPYKNPQALLVNDDGELWASCSGPLERGANGFGATGDGGLLQIDPDDLSIVRDIELLRFAPGTPAFTSEHVAVGSLVTPEVLVLPRAATHLDEGELLRLNDAATDSVFEVAKLPGGLVAAVVFSTDRLHVIDPRTSTLHPFPFDTPIGLATGDLSRGAQSIARVPRGDDRDEPDFVALLGLSAELVPLRLWEVLGP